MLRMSVSASCIAPRTTCRSASPVMPRGLEPSLHGVEPEHREGEGLARAVVQVGADATALQLGQGRGPRRGVTDPVAQLRVLVEQRRELADLPAKLAVLTDDGRAALADDADERQVGQNGRAGDQSPGDQAVVVDLGLELVGELIELGHGDDPGRAARANRQVDLDEVVPALPFVDVLRVGQRADVPDHRAARGLRPVHPLMSNWRPIRSVTGL